MQISDEQSEPSALKHLFCATRFGSSAKIVDIEVSFIRALPNFIISGYAENVIKESKERVQAALSACEFKFPPLKITINLSPSDLPKFGSHFDLPIALLIAMHNQKTQKRDIFAFGELGLDGSLKHSDFLFALILDVMRLKKDAFLILPFDSKKALSAIPNLNCYYARNLREALAFLKNKASTQEMRFVNKSEPSFPNIQINDEKYFYEDNFELDFSDIKGQVIAKRAALIASAGFHNIIFEGSPGCGKSMIANRMSYILPPLSLDQMLESSRIKALSNEDITITPRRNFRAPHQSASQASVIGSVSKREPMPGEIALAHHGILFFDELPLFKKNNSRSLARTA